MKNILLFAAIAGIASAIAIYMFSNDSKLLEDDSMHDFEM